MASPQTMMREMVLPEHVRFFMGEARQAARAAARGQAYLPAPETAARAGEIGERMREKGFGLMEALPGTHAYLTWIPVIIQTRGCPRFFNPDNH